MGKKILAVGLPLASDDVEFAEFNSKTSLLDWDVILFSPNINDFIGYGSEKFQGKPSLNSTASFELQECCEHWRREIKEAYESGKTVITYLPSLVEVYVDTGKREYSGTGRNQKTTIKVAPYNNYDALPVNLSPVSTVGASMKLSDKGAEILAPYWTEFGEVSRFNAVLTDKSVPAAIVTRTGAKVVGAIYRSKVSPGALILLPDIDFEGICFDTNDEDETYETEAGRQFCARFIRATVALDRAVRTSAEVTPEPSWAADDKFVLSSEYVLKAQLLDVEQQLEAAQRRKEELLDALRDAGSLRGLLFEKGKLLENAIISALKIMGFTASSYKDSESEFDVVFESSEGRLIGEAEGKDSKPVNIDKLRQLSMNVFEDLQREGVSKPAKAVLFGNGFRLQQLAERGDPFTEKCHASASTSSTALVATCDLFAPAQYLTEQHDPAYAEACRKALLATTGRVVFPERNSGNKGGDTLELLQEKGADVA